jgi:flagellar biosynthetic protein FliR
MAFLSDSSVAGFLLLFVRFSSLLAFLPFFSHSATPITIKAALSLYLTILFYPIVPQIQIPLDENTIITAAIIEATFGFTVGFLLNIVFAAFGFAGEQIAMVMGLSMASSFDPVNQQSSQIISQFFGFLLLVGLLAFDGHHWMIRLAYDSLLRLPLGVFVIDGDWFRVTVLSIKQLFVLGFTIAFPIVALSILSDIIFGMIMKTMPAFNLLVVGAPVKIALGIIVIVATLSAYMVIFEREFSSSISLVFRLINR